MDALVELIPLTSALARLDNPLQTLCRVVDRCGGVFRLSYAEVHETESLLVDLLGASPRSAEAWAALDVDVADPSYPSHSMTDGRVRRRPMTDGILVGDEALVLRGSQPYRLSSLGRTIWQVAAQTPTLAELVERVVEEHGDHPEATAIVGATLRTMCEARLIGYEGPRAVGDVIHACAPPRA